jgi:predicted transposase YdaD
MHEYDMSSKWLIQHFGDSILRLAGVRGIVSWRSLQADFVQPRRIPDGFVEVQRLGQATPDLYILEIATYPEARVAHQVLADTAMVYLDRQVLPEVVVLFLNHRGKRKALDALNLSSPRGLTNLKFSWRIAKLWEIPAQELLAAGDIGLIPWVPLTKFKGTPESMIRQCRAHIDQVTSRDEHENLLAVTQFLARIRYDDPKLFEILGGLTTMIESPLFQELRAKWTQEAKIEGKIEARIEALMAFLVGRFGSRAKALETQIKAINDETRLQELVEHAATCRTLSSFRKQLM